VRADLALRTCMLGLVLVDLLFVQLTGATGLHWLAPLVLLTLLSPWTGRLRHKLLYRALWNLGVLAFFAVLLWHATGDDLVYVLEDGLVLAALCQVHLLNNLRSDQRPDLLFLNSFLIAIVTGFLSQDLGFPLAFLVYVPFLVIGLQLLCITRHGELLRAADTLRVVRDGLARSGLLLLATLLVFLFWPRDFHREGFLFADFDFASSSDDYEVAFSESLSLDRTGRTTASDQVVMRVTLRRGSPSQVPALWRGATLGATNGREWWPFARGDFAAAALEDPYWNLSGSSLVHPAPPGPHGPWLRVENTDPQANRLFAPLGALRIDLQGVTDPRRVTATPDGALRYGEPSNARPTLEYDLSLSATRVLPSDLPIPAQVGPVVARFCSLPRSSSLEQARELADQLASRLPAGRPQRDVVERFAEYLSGLEYLPPGADGAARDLDSFLKGEAGAHCEFFASALATMLRSQSIPCRLATGYRSNEWDAERHVLTFRRRHAHAWVEVFDPGAGWYAVDPTPATLEAEGPSMWARLETSLGMAWGWLAGFDARGRGEVFAWLRRVPGQVGEGLRSHPGSACLIALCATICSAVLVRLRRRGDPSVRRYRRALRRLGLQLEPGETPRDLLDRVQEHGLARAQLDSLRASTRSHELSRYAA